MANAYENSQAEKWLEEMQGIAKYTCEIQAALQADEEIDGCVAAEVLENLKRNYKRMSVLSAYLSGEIHTVMRTVTEICENQKENKK